MRENIVPTEVQADASKKLEKTPPANESLFDTLTDDDLVTNYVIPTNPDISPITPTSPGSGEIYEEINMDQALAPEVPAPLTRADFDERTIIEHKKKLAASGLLVPGINDATPKTEPVLRERPLTEADYERLTIPKTFKGDGSEFKVAAIEAKKQALEDTLGLKLPGVIHTKPIPNNQKRLSVNDFTPTAIADAKAQYFMQNPGSFPINESIDVTATLKANEPLTRGDFRYATLEDEYELNERRRLGLPLERNPRVDPTSARYREFHLKGRIDPNLEVPIKRQPSTPETTATPAYTYIATVREKPLVKPDDYQRTGNLINSNATRLTPKDFPRYGPRAVLPTPHDPEPVKPKPSIFKRLKTEFLERFWYR